MNRTRTYLINGDFSQTLSPLDRGFAYGDGVFRTMLMRNGQPEQWPLHYQKLVADCAVIGVVCPSAELLMSDMQHLFSVTDNQVEVAKIIITRGEGERGYAPPAITNPTRVVIKSAMPKYAADNFIHGVNLHVCDMRLVEQPKLAGIKHLNRLENVLARMEWQDDSFDGLMLDMQDNVIECTMSNVFARFDNTLVTPDLSQCGVAGITRQRIIWLASLLDLKVEIKPLPFAKMALADEVIICSSLYGALQVNKVGHKKLPQQNLANHLRSALNA